MVNVAKVIKAPPNADVAIGSDQVRAPVLGRIGNTPGARAVIPVNPGEFFPYRGKELLELVNEQLEGIRVNSNTSSALIDSTSS
jgi:hypothetical protein